MHIGNNGKERLATAHVAVLHMVWAEKLAKGMHALACQNHKKNDETPSVSDSDRQKTSRNLLLIKKTIFHKKNLAIFEQDLFSGKSSLIYKHSSCPSPLLLL